MRKESDIEPGLKIYSNPQILNSVSNFLARKGSALNIVLEEPIDGGLEAHPLVSLVKSMKESGQLEGVFVLKQAKQSLLKKLEDSSFNHHIMIMDESAYRVETDTTNAKAFVNFGDSKKAKSLFSLFSNLYMIESDEVLRVA